ncbi:hypothetical protein PXH59_15020 [Xenorhabdus sp. SF857]|uniref:hypothetical protein n=1 Tax=Xenorhabdus bakwenae TaxID=3026967 RepID=UPI002557F595|nr:hypothetical protein [Xenorhabdus sp. SF857]WFQ78946.1 hypothetical protein PXH59_15020 [Xenorhabdus sp. SF857]
MNTIKVVGIELAKNVFQVCVWMEYGFVTLNRKISQQKLLDTVRIFPSATVIAMKACATSHYWGRTLQEMGFIIRLVPTQNVNAFNHHQNLWEDLKAWNICIHEMDNEISVAETGESQIYPR